jgi:hypothetical protein
MFFIAFHTPGLLELEDQAANAHAEPQRQPAHPTAVHPAHQAHWVDQDTNTEEGASYARHTMTGRWGSAVGRDAADDGAVGRTRKWASYIGGKGAPVGAGAAGSWGILERSGEGRLVVDGAGAERGEGWIEEQAGRR